MPILPLQSAWWNPLSWDAPFGVVAAALFVIVTARASATYLLGRFLRRSSDQSRRASLAHRPGFQAAEEKLNRWGAPAVTLSFLTVGVQTMVNLAAGFTRMPLRRYLPALVLGCMIWATVYASAGFIGIGAFMTLWRVHPALAIILVALVVVAVIALVRGQSRGQSQDSARSQG
ncbi:DedA family protein [Luteococcus sp. Sow4_B9]|uniref:DedA family protein n=1 Tax=Luteococcus sp. Sow4_B9 TaxID=3438792 RepID=UPI003F96913B